MKTNLLFAAALLVSSVALAQEATVKSQDVTSANAGGNSGNTKVSASSDATIKTNAVSRTATKADETKQVVKKEAIAEKEAVAGKAREDEKASQKAVQEKSSASVNAHSNTQATIGSGDNKTNQDASLSNRTAVSVKSVKSSGKEAVQATKPVEIKAKNAMIQTETDTKKDAKTASGSGKTDAKTSNSAAVKSGAAVQHAPKPKPTSIKMQSQLKGNAGLKIK